MTEDSEECDDGNRCDGDGCASYCTMQGCPVSTTSVPTSPVIPTDEQNGTATEATATETEATSEPPSFCMSSDCEMGSLIKEGTVHLSNFALQVNSAEVDPQTIRELNNGRALMAQVLTILRHPVMFSMGKLDSQEQPGYNRYTCAGEESRIKLRRPCHMDQTDECML